jgi:hypothetical protein
LVSVTENWNNTIAYNKFSNKWGIDITNIVYKSKTLLAYGVESRTNTEFAIKPRWQLGQYFTLGCVQKIGNTTLISPITNNNRNYNIQYTITEPKLTYTYLAKCRFAASYMYKSKQNEQTLGGENIRFNSLNIEAKYNTVNSLQAIAKIAYTHIQSKNLLANAAINYIVLEGLQIGKNYVWSIDLLKRIGNGLELNINYEGRKSNENNSIHIARAGIRALL